MNKISQTTLKEVVTELEKSFEKWPFRENIFKQLAVLTEEAGELSQAILQYQDEGLAPEHARFEAIQTAAMALKMIMYIDKKGLE